MINFKINHVQETSSSNTYLKNLSIKTGCDEGTVIMADFQTDGRGQGDNQWHSHKELNLLASILLKPEIDAEHFFSITSMVSLAVLDVLKEFGVSASIKWPNDIYVEDFKIAGLLIENSLVETKITKSIIGIGMNVNQSDFPEWITNPISMAKLRNREFEIVDILNSLLAQLHRRYAQVKEHCFTELLSEYNYKLYRKGMRCNFESDAGSFRAKICEVGAKGEFILFTESGETKSFLFGEIKMES